MAFDTNSLGRFLKGAADMLRSAAGTPKAGRSTTGKPKTRTSSPHKPAGRRKPAPAPKPGLRPVPPAAAKPAGRGAAAGTVPQLSSPYPGDFSGRAKASYAPK